MPYDDFKLIKLLKANEVLYNKNHVLANTNYKRRVWADIAQEMGLPADRVEKRYRCLRDRFVRYKRALLTKGPENNYDLAIMDQMEFLTPFIFIKSGGGKITWEGPDASICISTDRLQASAKDSNDSEDYDSTKSSKKPKRRTRTKRNRRADSLSIDSDEDYMPKCKTAKVTDAASQKCAISARSENDMNSNTNTDSHFEADERQHSEVDYNADLDAAFCDAVKCFMRICNGGDSKKENKALHGFGQMIIATISEMNIAKQAKVMSLVTEAVMQMKMEDDGYNGMTKT